MTKIDLITGFLGSGKTTFLKQYLDYWIRKGERVCVLEFDYGAVNVDMMLLQNFNGKVDMEMVAGGCDYDCHLRRFKTKLIAMGMKHYDRVIVEPSGIFDCDEFFDTLVESPLDQWYEIGSILTIVDCGIHDLSKESCYILMNQVASAGKILISKTQLYPPEKLTETIRYLSSILAEYHLKLDPTRLVSKPFSAYNDNDFAMFAGAGYQNADHLKWDVIGKNEYDSVYLLDVHLSLSKLAEVSKKLFQDNHYGSIIRIKGFIKENEQWYEINLTKEEKEETPILEGQDVIIVIGEDLDKEAIISLLK